MNQHTIKTKGSEGITLVEILVVMVIVGILGSALVTMQYFLSQNQVVVFRSYLNVDDANSSVTLLVRELRTASVSDNGAYALADIQDQQITFYSDIDFDGQVERVRYFLSGSQFSKGIIEPTGQPATYPSANEKVKVLSNNVQNDTTPVFYYYNEDWPQDTVNNPLQVPGGLSETKLIRIYLRLNPLANDPTNDYVLESNVQLRMLKENL